LLGSLAASCLLAGSAGAQTMQDALISAYQTNPQLEADRARQRAQDDDVSRAWGGFRPQIVLSGDIGRAHDRVLGPTYQPIYSDPKNPLVTDFNPELFHFDQGTSYDRYPNSETVQIKQEIWDGGRTFSDVTHSKWAVANGRAILTSTEQTVLGGVVQAYYDLYRDQKILEIQKEFVKSLQDEKKAATARYGVKDVTRTDVAQSEARLARGLADQRQYEGNVEISRSAFILASGLVPGTLIDPPPLPTNLLPKNLDEALGEIERNPDLQAAIFAEKASEADISTAESGLMPDLSAVAVGSHNAHSDYTGLQITTGEVLLELTIPIYDGGVASARTRIAKHTFGQRRLTTDLQRIRTNDAIKRSWQNLMANQARIVALEENERADLVALDGVQQELKVGSRTVLDELNARQEVLDAQIALWRSRHDAAVGAYGLLVAVGRLNADALALPVERYDATDHYESASWLPWSPWIDKTYPDGTPVSSDAMPGGSPWQSFLPDIDLPSISLPSLFDDDKDEKKTP
jgi:TolC family type I secretion outer membrane protein